MADERVETCLTCESAVGFGSSQSLGSPGSHETPTGRFGSMGAAPRSEAQQVPEGETRLVGTAEPNGSKDAAPPLLHAPRAARVGNRRLTLAAFLGALAALAAVVLYNLISVNLGERKKELATIKVLGFYDQEVYRYIFREIELLALIGSGVGLALGVPLHKFIILTVEMDQLMFIRTIAPRSYLLAVALTMVFTVVVCFVMRRHVRRISMVDSMKAPE